jgi:hypothetical protein
MPNTMTLIGAVTVGSGGASSVAFSSIPGTYTDLCLKLSTRSSGSSGTYDPMRILINSSTYSAFSMRGLYGTGTSAGNDAPGTTDSNLFGYTSNSTNTANAFGSAEIYIPNYTSTSYAKSMSIETVSETNGTGGIVYTSSSLWNPGTQAAVTSITISPYSGASTFAQYSTAYLYGIKNS